MREWYGLHFPELDNLIQSISLYANIVREAGFRASITRELLERLGLDEKGGGLYFKQPRGVEVEISPRKTLQL